MGDRKTVTTGERAFETLKAHKRDGESWDDLYQRAAAALDAVAEDEHGLNTADPITQDDLDDFRVQLRRELGEDIENRLTRR